LERELAAKPIGSRSPVVYCGEWLEHIITERTDPCRVVQGTIKGRAARALRTHKPATREKQRWAKANEEKLANSLSGTALDDNEPMDILLKSGGKEHGIELKTLLDNANDKITMHPDALARKRAWMAERTNRTIHTVAMDDRNVFATGKFKHQFSGHQMYYKRGAGAFRIKSMIPVRDAKQLHQLIDASDDELKRLVAELKP